jgi:hypothetical protein
MVLLKGNMWDVYEESDLFCITTNSYVTGSGHLVMGRGIAEEAAEKFPELPAAFGSLILDYARDSSTKINYYLVHHVALHMAAFQVKYHYRHPARIELIKGATKKLSQMARERPTWRFDLNFPGVGYGGLERDLVLKAIQRMPDNIHIWEFGD